MNLTQRYLPPLLNGDTTATRYVYDLDKRITNTIRSDSITVSVEYDTLGCGTCGSAARPKTIQFDRGELNFTYNGFTGQLTSVSAPGGNAITYTYDGSLPKKVTWSGEVQGNVEATYDNSFRVSSQKVNASDSVSFQYDRESLLTAAGELTIARDSQNGRIKSTTLGSIITNLSYNNFGELASFLAFFASDTLFKTVYKQDSLGRITEITETIQGQTKKFTYLYDAAGRLTDMSRNDTLLAVYTYDANGNRLSLDTPAETRTGTYDSQDRQLTYGNASYSYTRNGDLLTKLVGSDTTRYTYDAFGNLVSVRLPNGTRIEYAIDGQNRRIGKKVNGAFVKRWLYGNQLNIVAELDSAGNIVSRFVYGTRGNVPDYMIKAGLAYRIISDHLGSVRLVINSTSGAIVQQMDYDEFGSITTDTNPGFEPFGFAGGLHDEHSKLVRFGARDYDVTIGRWAAKDPIRFEGGDGNLYGYALNSPVNVIDPNGLELKYGGSVFSKLFIWFYIQKLKWNSPTGAKIINHLERSNEEVKIIITSGSNRYYSGSNVCAFNPDIDELYSGVTPRLPWYKRPPEIGLAHELIHAYHDINGTAAPTRAQREAETVGFDFFSIITYTENRIRTEYGISLRPRY